MSRIWNFGQLTIYQVAMGGGGVAAPDTPGVYSVEVREVVRCFEGEKQVLEFEETFPVRATGWINAVNAIERDDRYATHVTDGSRTAELVVSGFNLNLPADFELDDLIVSVHRRLL